MLKTSLSFFSKTVLFIGILQISYAQVPIGAWRFYPDFKAGKGIELADNQVYCYAKNGFFVYDKISNEATVLSKLDGFAESVPSRIYYAKETKQLFIGYASGGIDWAVLEGYQLPKKIIFFDKIAANKGSYDSKKINAFFLTTSYLYVATDFGIVLIDLKKEEVKDVYQLYDNDYPLAILNIFVSTNSIFVATLNGVLEAKNDDKLNLKDQKNWKTSSYLGFQNADFKKKTDEVNIFWQADATTGFSKTTAGKTTDITPKSINFEVESLHSLAGKVIAKGSDKASVFEQNQWQATKADGLMQNQLNVGGFKWYLSFGDVVVENPKTNQERRFGSYNSLNISGDAVSLSVDRKGAVWVGTTNGVSVFDNPTEIFTAKAIIYQPESLNKRLFFQEKVQAIVFDPANRKWVGTTNGLYLVDEANKTLFNFTTENSPIPQNSVQSLGFDDASGEVFILAGALVASVRSDATMPAENLDAYKIFPNPVPPRFDGVVAIEGLPANAQVRIVDAAGRLLYETRPNGGTATWNLQDTSGRNLETGVYFVLLQDETNTEKLIGKLAVLR